MDLNIDTLAHLQEMSSESGTNEELYNKMLHFIHNQINQKDIHFDTELLKRFDVDEDINLKFDNAYFDNGNHNPLYVMMSALADEEVYNWLEYAYNKTHDQSFSHEVIESEIERLKKIYWQVLFDHYVLEYSESYSYLYMKKRFNTNKGRIFDIDHVHTEFLEDGKIEAKIVIEFDNYQTFTAILENDEKYKMAVSFPPPKNYDEVYILAEDQIKDKISEYWDSK